MLPLWNHTHHNSNFVRAIVVVLALGVALTLPGGRVESAHSEHMVMAGMTAIDAEHERDFTERTP